MVSGVFGDGEQARLTVTPGRRRGSGLSVQSEQCFVVDSMRSWA